MLFSELVTLSTTICPPLTTSTLTAVDAARVKRSFLQWHLDWSTDCHKIAFGDGFSPTQEMFDSQSYVRFREAFCCNMQDGSPEIKRIYDGLSRFYLLVTRSLEPQSRARQLVDEDEREIRSFGFDLDRYVAPFIIYKYFASDDAGRLAWVPRRARAGDVFCVFLGAKVPHLLRPVANGRYELIGECYLQDCMDGKIVDADHIAVQEFVLV